MVYEFQIDSSIISNFLHMRISKFMWKKIQSIFLIRNLMGVCFDLLLWISINRQIEYHTTIQL